MRGLKLGIIGVVFSSFAAIATAQADDCQNASSQAALNECFGNAYKKSDAELNKLFKTLQRRADDADLKKKLVQSQRAWIAFRDAECDMQTFGGGSIVGTSYPICLSGLTTQRINDLKGYLKCDEGDSNCPFPAASN
ncbi:lysozyme inhibitor LprI family protein [Brucella tritici]|uniref:lysozyme inhibitor LprI family protein n=1 Tax=Brucella/Ochrobactrum group TaxID=2826938 RepID=UPI0015913456|nr:lysozyme inhibitor LprI family protein [Brucella tritici]MCH4539928.1 lysozyme inhibitor LprI family protein [Ochrobactrum sp. A-1]